MMDELKQKHFNPKAHILTLLGEELIKSPVMAIYELVKNSYDADALKVDVYFRDIENIAEASIVIEDNGIGMTDEIVENVWLEPGSDFRKPVNATTGLREIKKSPIFKRVPMGEKGVGRFAVHKLGSEILLISRPRIIELSDDGTIVTEELANYELQLYINWKDFKQSLHLSDVPIQWTVKHDPSKFRFRDKSGTYIRISSLKETWTKGMARQLKGQTLSMLSPRLSVDSFKINLNFQNQWLVDFPTAEKIIEDAPYKITALLDEGYNLDFEYEFRLKRNENIGNRTIKNDRKYNRNIKGDIRASLLKYLESKEYEKDKIKDTLLSFDDNDVAFGSLIIEFYSFDLDAVSLRDYTEIAEALKKILKEHAGIKVFKGDMRVYDYGEPGNDWLGLDQYRINDKEWFSNNQNIGYVYLDPEGSANLVEKTNREGFIENNAYLHFFLILRYILNEFKATRSSDRTKWLKYNHRATSKLFDDKVSSFRAIVDDMDFTDSEKRTKLIQEAEKLEEKYEDDKNSLLIPAGVGMTASVALHEIEKLVPRMEETVRAAQINKELISEQVAELKQYTDGIISVLRKGGTQAVDVRDCVSRAFNNYKLKLANRLINYSVVIDLDVISVNCDKRLFITILMNLIDNSIHWLGTVYRDQKSIYLKAFKVDGATHIILADYGPGFKDDISDLIRPFFSRKEDGIGIGLYLIDTIMMKFGKLEIITDVLESTSNDIPQEFTGAIVRLIFNKNQNV